MRRTAIAVAVLCWAMAGCGTLADLPDPGPPPFDPIPSVGEQTAKIPGIGRYTVNVTGQVLDGSGSFSFSQPAIVDVREQPDPYYGVNPIIVTIDTAQRVAAAGDALGALTFSSSAPRGGVPSDAVAIRLFGADVVLSSTLDVPPPLGTVGFFRAGVSQRGALAIASVEGRLRLSGNTVSGTLRLADVTGTVLYSAQVVGTRVP